MARKITPRKNIRRASTARDRNRAVMLTRLQAKAQREAVAGSYMMTGNGYGMRHSLMRRNQFTALPFIRARRAIRGYVQRRVARRNVKGRILMGQNYRGGR